MPTTVKVCINGFVLSTLLFDCTNNSGDQEGFLYGSITRNVRREISDQSMSNTQEDILISICSSVPCGSFLSFYNNVGEIKREDLEYNLGERVQNIVGWYRFRRYSAMYPSAREQSIHRNLRALFSNYDNVDDSYFVFGLLSSSNLPNFATHSYDYGFFIQRRDCYFKDLDLTILNLGDTRNSYRSGSLALPFMNSSSFNSVLSSSWNFSSFYETENQIHQFHQRLRMKLDSLQEELAASDAVNASLEDDIRRLSNEMQTLLATQDRLANATALRELELAEACAAAAAEEKETTANEREMQEINERGVSTESNKIESAASPERESSESRDSSDSKESESMICKASEHLDSVDDESRKSESSEIKEKAGDSPRLKRASVYPVEDDRSTKRACPDKYFESGEYLEDQHTINSVNDTASSKKEDSQLLVVDPNSDDGPAVQNEDGNMKLAVASGEIEESTVPSPASNVEIVISDATLQSFESAMIVILSEFLLDCIIAIIIYGLFANDGFHEAVPDESITSSDELSDNKESDVKETSIPFNVEESSNASCVRKSVSDSAISSVKEASPPRSGSAHAELIGQINSALKSSEKLAPHEGTSKVSICDDSSCSANPPFIIYASKEFENKSKDHVLSISSISQQKTEESISEKSVADKPVVEGDQSSLSTDQKSDQKNANKKKK